MHRLFVALRPPPAIRDLLIDAMGDHGDFRWQSDDQLHLTLRFIGEVERPLAEDLTAALDRVHASSFELQLSGLGSFDQKNGGVIFAGVEPRDPVAALAARVDRACQSAGIAPDRRAFHPHITIARWSGRRSREARSFLDGRNLNSPPFLITCFSLVESRLSRHGAHYEEVANFALK
ncbi:MAG: RNA 2',3'-cyclic phosphodiesterase [Sphingomicrobium sp.]